MLFSCTLDGNRKFSTVLEELPFNRLKLAIIGLDRHGQQHKYFSSLTPRPNLKLGYSFKSNSEITHRYHGISILAFRLYLIWPISCSKLVGALFGS
ncbi:hypothetical protein BpHYR1_015932 [Brachionus plicatilis]|uniref:Uncharacterized protein n=1 Tax=Brachionus plicatilis TaxID=10195 RepID=A0A3M7S5Y3_BRAPC|nr:hypothetical protein BpHYR1_015932 [Brachionus plicatilis]